MYVLIIQLIITIIIGLVVVVLMRSSVTHSSTESSSLIHSDQRYNIIISLCGASPIITTFNLFSFSPKSLLQHGALFCNKLYYLLSRIDLFKTKFTNVWKKTWNDITSTYIVFLLEFGLHVLHYVIIFCRHFY